MPAHERLGLEDDRGSKQRREQPVEPDEDHPICIAQPEPGWRLPKINRRGVVERARLSTDAVRQVLLKRAAKAGLRGALAEPFSPHGLRAGFITTAYRNGVPDEEIMGHTRHRSL